MDYDTEHICCAREINTRRVFSRPCFQRKILNNAQTGVKLQMCIYRNDAKKPGPFNRYLLIDSKCLNVGY